MSESIRVPPCAPEVEKHVIGGLLLGDAEAYSALDAIEPKHFYDDRHRTIFETIKEIHAEDKTIDLVALSERLKASGRHESVGGDAYLLEISSEVASAAGMDHYCSILREKAERRRLIMDTALANAEAWDESKPLDDVRSRAEARLLDSDGHGPDGGPVSTKTALTTTLKLIEKAHAGEMQGLQTQFYKFNEMSGGLFAPDWIVLAGRPATGKTALALDIADYLATDDKKSVLFFSLEMPREQLMQRLICRRHGIDFHKLRTGKLSKYDFEKVAQSVEELVQSHLFIDDSPDSTPGRVLSVARRHKAKHGLDLVIVDNLSIMEGDKRTENRLQEVSSMTRAFKKNAKRLGVPIMTLVHLSRAIESRGEEAVPRMADLRECGTIEQDADDIYALHKPDPLDTRVDIHGLKQRNGPSNCVIPLTSEMQYMRFKSYEPRAGFLGSAQHHA